MPSMTQKNEISESPSVTYHNDDRQSEKQMPGDSALPKIDNISSAYMSGKDQQSVS